MDPGLVLRVSSAATNATSRLESQEVIISQLKDVSIFGAVFCFLMTFGRLYVRRGRWWWDDYIAGFSMTFMVFSTITVNLHLLYDTWLQHPQSIRVALFYLFNLGFYITMWSFRISVVFSFIRLGLFRRFLYPTIIIFVLMGLVLCAQVVWTCESESQLAWKLMMLPSCSLGRLPAIINVTFSVIADSVLLFTPLFALWRTRTIPFAHRVRLGVTFGSNILVTVSCMVHSAYVISKPGLDLVLVTVLQLTIALIVCNLPVTSAALHRVWTRHSHKRKKDALGGAEAWENGRAINSDTVTTLRFSIPGKPPQVMTFTRNSQHYNPIQYQSFCASSIRSTNLVHEGLPSPALPPLPTSPLRPVSRVTPISLLPVITIDDRPLIDRDEIRSIGSVSDIENLKSWRNIGGRESVASSRTVSVVQQDRTHTYKANAANAAKL